jgi:UMF1 family MFS transporter
MSMSGDRPGVSNLQREETGGRFPRGWIAWTAYDLGQRPFNFLILTYIFAPYFAATLFADPVRGQAVWGLTVAAAGILIAILAPPLGAIADAAGPKKPWIAVFGALLVAGCAALWFVRPGDPHAVTLAIVAIVVASVGSELSVVFHNALLPLLAARNRIGQLSGLGWAVGVAGGVAALLLVLAFLAVDPRTGLTLGGWAPPFTDPAQWPAGRVVGPLVAVWFAVFVLPMFIWMPDDRRSDRPLGPAAPEGL